MEGFHVMAGLTFQRIDAGVRVRWYHDEELAEVADLSASTWASAVASVTPQGDDALTFQRALNFWHYGRNEAPVAI